MKFAAALLVAVANAGVIFNRDSCDYTKADACADPSSGLRKNPAYYTYELCMTTSGCYKNIDPMHNEDSLQNLGLIFNRDSCDYTKADACADPSSGLRKNPAYYTYELCMTTSGCYKNIDPMHNEDSLQNLGLIFNRDSCDYTKADACADPSSGLRKNPAYYTYELCMTTSGCYKNIDPMYNEDSLQNLGLIFNRDSCDYTKADACTDPNSGLRKNPAYYTYELCMTTSGCYKNIDPMYNEDRLQNLA